MGRYGLILCANESYTNNLAFGINFDPILAHKKHKTYKRIIKKKGIGLHMGQYGLILCANESYINNLAIGINFDPIPAYNKNKKY